MGSVTMKEINSRKRRLCLSILTISVYWVGPTANRFRALRWEPSGNVNENQNNTHTHAWHCIWVYYKLNDTEQGTLLDNARREGMASTDV